MRSLIANKVTTNMRLVALKLFTVRTINVCHGFQLIQRTQQ